MYIIPNQVKLAILPSQISPVGSVAAIFLNGRYVTISQILNRRRAIIVVAMYRFPGAQISGKKSIAEYIKPLTVYAILGTNF